VLPFGVLTVPKYPFTLHDHGGALPTVPNSGVGAYLREDPAICVPSGRIAAGDGKLKSAYEPMTPALNAAVAFGVFVVVVELSLYVTVVPLIVIAINCPYNSEVSCVTVESFAIIIFIYLTARSSSRKYLTIVCLVYFETNIKSISVFL
jgi:hypothetical protein